MNRNILIAGYWENNLGDDLFLDIFTKRYPDSNIYLLSQKKYRKTYQSEQVHVVCYDELSYRMINALRRLFKLSSLFYGKYAKKCDTAVILSGSYFMEEGAWQRQLTNLMSIGNNIRHTFVIGTNFGPYHSDEFYQGYRKFFAMCDDVCFREQVSYELFKDLAHVRMAPDIVLGLDVLPSKKEKRLIISVIDCNKSESLAQYQAEYLFKMKEITRTFLDLDYKVTLFSFSEKQGDYLACQQISEDFHDERLEIFNHKNVRTSLEKLSTAELMIATRFHAMILGWVLDSHVFPIVYSKKMSNVIRDLGSQKEYIEIENIAQLDCTRLKEILIEPQPISSALFILAKNQFAAFDAYWSNNHE
jgi:colanic acid/amylovoran biosynthesis protein